MQDYLILNAGEGYRTKSYGPKCLFKLLDGKTILQHQAKEIESSGGSVNLVGGFEHHKIKKKYDYPMYVNHKYEDYNQIYSIVKACEDLDISSCFIISGDLVFKKLPKITPTMTTVYWSENSRPSSIGMTIDNKGLLSYMMWGLSPSWAEIAYLDSDTIDFFAEHLGDFERSFLIEGFNSAVDVGIDIRCEALGSKVIDVDQKSDIITASKLLKEKK